MFISAGEASGDRHGAAVARALGEAVPGARLFGIGGRELEAAGVTRLAGLSELAVMGGWEVARRLPALLRLERRIERLFAEEDVRLFLPVDYPGLNLRLARAARRQGRRVLYFIAPQVWAWRERRARRLARDCDRVLAVLPFEGEVLRRHGARAEFVGHPLLDEAPPAARTRLGEAGRELGRADGAADGGRGGPDRAGGRQRRLVGLFPGSRAQEVRLLLPVFAAAGRELARRAARRGIELELLVARPAHLSPELYAEARLPTADAGEVVRRAWAALSKSGTITLELALAGVPAVVGHRVSRLEWAAGRRLVRLPSIVLVNLVAEAPVVPELLQDRLTPGRACAALEPLIEEGGAARADMLRAYEEVRSRLGAPGCAGRVAAHAAELLGADAGAAPDGAAEPLA